MERLRYSCARSNKKIMKSNKGNQYYDKTSYKLKQENLYICEMEMNQVAVSISKPIIYHNSSTL